MNLKIINSEITSPALKEVAKTLGETLIAVRSKRMEIAEAQLSVTTCKHVLQAIAIDWMYNRPTDRKVIEHREHEK